MGPGEQIPIIERDEAEIEEIRQEVQALVNELVVVTSTEDREDAIGLNKGPSELMVDSMQLQNGNTTRTIPLRVIERIYRYAPDAD